MPSAATATSVVGVSAGRRHSCALLQSGDVKCWGYNYYGELGLGNRNDIGDDELPTAAGTISLGGSVAELAAGDFHTCALLTNGDLRCWGLNTFGELGLGNTNTIGISVLPSEVEPVSYR